MAGYYSDRDDRDAGEQAFRNREGRYSNPHEYGDYHRREDWDEGYRHAERRAEERREEREEEVRAERRAAQQREYNRQQEEAMYEQQDDRQQEDPRTPEDYAAIAQELDENRNEDNPKPPVPGVQEQHAADRTAEKAKRGKVFDAVTGAGIKPDAEGVYHLTVNGKVYDISQDSQLKIKKHNAPKDETAADDGEPDDETLTEGAEQVSRRRRASNA